MIATWLLVDWSVFLVGGGGGGGGVVGFGDGELPEPNFVEGEAAINDLPYFNSKIKRKSM